MRSKRSWSSVAAACVMSVGLSFLCGCEGGSSGGGLGGDVGDNDPDLYVAMGDSITAAGWPSLLSAKLGAPVVNRGTPGAMSDHGASTVNGTLARYKPGFLLIMYGANDLIHNQNPNWTVANLRSMIRAAKANKTIPVIATLTPMSGSHGAWAGNVKAMNVLITSMAKEEGAAVANVYKAFGNNPAYILPDGLHPTAAGSDRIAATFAGRIR